MGQLESSIPRAIGQDLAGVLRTTEEIDFNLNESSDKEVKVLIFAQDTCITCAAEAKEISAKITQLGNLPQNVEIITFMVGAVGQFAAEDSRDWKRAHNVQWTVGFQKDEENLFRKYFGASSVVPSILIEKNNKIVFQHSGALGVEELEEQTGEWK